MMAYTPEETFSAPAWDESTQPWDLPDFAATLTLWHRDSVSTQLQIQTVPTLLICTPTGDWRLGNRTRRGETAWLKIERLESRWIILEMTPEVQIEFVDTVSSPHRSSQCNDRMCFSMSIQTPIPTPTPTPIPTLAWHGEIRRSTQTKISRSAASLLLLLTILIGSAATKFYPFTLPPPASGSSLMVNTAAPAPASTTSADSATMVVSADSRSKVMLTDTGREVDRALLSESSADNTGNDKADSMTDKRSRRTGLDPQSTPISPPSLPPPSANDSIWQKWVHAAPVADRMNRIRLIRLWQQIESLTDMHGWPWDRLHQLVNDCGGWQQLSTEVQTSIQTFVERQWSAVLLQADLPARSVAQAADINIVRQLATLYSHCQQIAFLCPRQPYFSQISALLAAELINLRQLEQINPAAAASRATLLRSIVPPDHESGAILALISSKGTK